MDGDELHINNSTTTKKGAHGSLVVEALCYKPQGRRLRPNDVNEFSQFS
jgi:hypothetical protein